MRAEGSATGEEPNALMVGRREANRVLLQTPGTATDTDKPGPYDKGTESQKVAEAAAAAKRNNVAYHPVYAAAIANISASHKEKGMQDVIPTDEASIANADAFGPQANRGVDGGRHRPSGDFRRKWKQREDLVMILRRIKSLPHKGQVAKHQLYLETEQKLKDLETSLGKPYDAANDAIQRMKAAALGDTNEATSKQYEKAKRDLKAAIAQGPPINTGVYHKYISNPGHSQAQLEEAQENDRLRRYSESLRANNRRIKENTRKEDAANLAYEADGMQRPGCAYIDGPCDHSEKDVPGKPLHLKQSYVKIHEATLSWQVPKINRSFITGYKIMAKKTQDKKAQWQKISSATHGMQEIMHRVTGLQANTEYAFRVQAMYVPVTIRKMSVNDLSKELQLNGQNSNTDDMQRNKPALMQRLATLMGEPAGPPSDDLVFRTPKGVPARADPPRVTSVKYTTGKGIDYSLSWTAPNPEGAPILGYHVEATKGGDLWGWEPVVENTGSNATSATFPGFQGGGVAYQFRVGAINEMGRARLSRASLQVMSPPTKVPAAVARPTADTFYCKNGACGFRLKWKTPMANGAEITGYQILYRMKNYGKWRTYIDDTRSAKTMHVMAGLKGGMLYNVRVRAKNSAGFSAYDAPVADISTTAGQPLPPTKPIFGNITATGLKLQWTKPHSNGAPILGYKITMQTGGTGGYFTKIANTMSTKLTANIEGLTEGGYAYTFKVQGINAKGIGKASPASDPATTKYDTTSASKRATKKAHDNFKVNHKLYTLRQLSAGYKLYKKNYEEALYRLRISKEKVIKGDNAISQLRAKGRINGQILSAKLALERDMMTKKLQIGDRVDNMARTVAQDAFQKKLDAASKLFDERVIDQRKYYQRIIQKNVNQVEGLRDEVWKLNNELQKQRALNKKMAERAKGVNSKNAVNLRESQSDSDKAAEVARLNTLFDRGMNNAVENDQTKHMLGQAKTEHEVNAVQAFLMKAEPRPQHPTKGAVVELGAQAKQTEADEVEELSRWS